MTEVIIDVRERDEFAIEHIENSINVPLSVFSMVVPGVLKHLQERKILIMCQSGIRAAQAVKIAQDLDLQDKHDYVLVEGGLVQLMKNGKEVVKGDSNTFLPIMRQVHLIVGLLILIFSSLSIWYDPRFSFVAAAIGAGLFFAGATGICLLAKIVAAMPWNQSTSNGLEPLPCKK